MANEIAFSDKGIMLYYKKNLAYEELVGIKDVPPSGGEPAQLDVTELKSLIIQHIPDRTDSPAQNFLYNRTTEKFEKVLSICDGLEHEFLIRFNDGTSTFIKGIPSTWRNNVTKGSVQEATLSISPSEISYKTVAQTSALLPGVSA